MKFKKLLVTNPVVLSMLLLLLTSNPAMAQKQYWYDPSGDETDARFLAVAGTGFDTFIRQPIALYIHVPASETRFEIGIFDGDTRGIDANGEEHWDQPTENTEAYYRLYADPDKNGEDDESKLIKEWKGNHIEENGEIVTMPDNAWFSRTVENDERALGPDGSTYTYRLEADLVNSNTRAVNRFKVRATGALTLGAHTPFAFEAALKIFPSDAVIVYPNWPSFTPTTYDGTWTFKILVTGAPGVIVNEVTVWDGDLDHGSHDGAKADTDDPDTPNNEIPFFAAQYPDTLYEDAKVIGSPADDNYPPIFRREPAIFYTVSAPDGKVWTNSNPSGNREWEKFTIRTEAHPDGCIPGVNADYCANSLEPGIYTVTVKGVDLNNLNAFYFPYETLTYNTGSIGNYVWFDLNCDGIQDTYEVGIEGVTVNLYDADGNLYATTTTNAVGYYLFYNLLAGTYTVDVDESTLPEGLMLTTANEPHTVHLAEAQDYLDADFGYCEGAMGGQGCTPGYWKQKQHFDSWVKYSPEDRFDVIFGVNYPLTLLEALGKGGGAEMALGRHATAALLNAATHGVNYSYTEQEIISMVQQAWETGDYETTKNLLAAENERGCPLN